MKVLFINPSQEHFIKTQTGWSPGIKDFGYYQPLGILSVATFLKENNPSVQIKVIDAASPDMPYPELEKRMREFDPDVVGVSTYTHSFVDSLKVAQIAKKINHSVHVNFGGHHLTFFPKETLCHDIIDSIIIGEGEIRFSELINCLQAGKNIEDIDGVFTKKNLEQIDGYKQTFIENISELPFPDRELLNDFRYYNTLTVKKKMTTICSSRGCPYSCTFCVLGKEPYRQRSSRDVVNEIEYLMKQGYTDFFFSEDTFNINNKKVNDFCNEIKNRNLKFSWCCKARVRGMDFETLKNMTETGCYLINFGVETGSNEGLKILKKGLTTEEIQQVFKWCRELKIKTMAYFMIGNTFEKTEADIMKNVDFLFSLKPDFCNITSVNPFPYTQLFDEGVKKGLLSYEPWKKMITTGEMFTPQNWEEYFTKEELQKIRNKILLKFYLRPTYILKQIMDTRSFSQLFSKSQIGLNLLKEGIRNL